MQQKSCRVIACQSQLYHVMSEQNFLLNDEVCDYSQTRLYRTLEGLRNFFALIFREGSVAGVCYVPKVYQGKSSQREI